jgi:hypothetical protein
MQQAVMIYIAARFHGTGGRVPRHRTVSYFVACQTTVVDSVLLASCDAFSWRHGFEGRAVTKGMPILVTDVAERGSFLGTHFPLNLLFDLVHLWQIGESFGIVQVRLSP